MDKAVTVKVKLLYDKVKNREKKGHNIKEILHKIGYENAVLDPPDHESLTFDNPSKEIYELRLSHYESKREKILKKVLFFMKTQKKSSSVNKPLPYLSLNDQSSPDISAKKEQIENQNKRRSEVTDRMFKLHLDQKLKLLQKLKQKEEKSTEQKNKTLATIKERIEQFQEKEQKKLDSAKLNKLVINIQEQSPRKIRAREFYSNTPSFERNIRAHDRVLNTSENYSISERLQKFQEKMTKASERHNKAINDRIKQNEQRSQSVNKVRNDFEKKRKIEDQMKLKSLINLDEAIKKTQKLKTQYLIKKCLKRNKSFSRANKTESKELESFIKQKDSKIKEKLANLKFQCELGVSIKKEKFKLNFSDLLEKRELQNKARFDEKNRILNKHLNTAKLLEHKKAAKEKNDMEVREKEFWHGQSCVQQKYEMVQKIKELESKTSFLITNQL